MKKSNFLVRLLSVATLCSCLSFSAFAGEITSGAAKHEPTTEQLITMVEHNAELKAMLVESIEQTTKINPDRVTNPVRTLEEYYNFIDWAAKAMPWSIIPNIPWSSLYDQIDQSLDYFYFVNDQPIAGLKGKGYYNNSLQYHEPYRTWLINFTKEWGLYLSKEGSWNDAYYKKALEDDRFGLNKGWYEDPSNWKTFNDFFARYLKSPDQRPIAAPTDQSIIASPADSKPQGVWRIDKESNIVAKKGVVIKSGVFKSVAALVGEGSAYKHAFAGGTLTHTFLDVNDYHRYHFPLEGIIKEVRTIQSDDAVGGYLTWDPGTKKYMLDANTPGWQNIETRGCVIIDTPKYGVVALLPIGMSQVCSVNFEKGVKVGTTVKKGDMLGYFLFGGSDFVMLFQKKVDFNLTAPKESSGAFKHLLMGQEYGRVTIRR
ncbi:phosphatidylserine decarboxylase [Chlorobium ferrooxidans]|uniref:Phosphatidylserine decarboxylase-related n=1 Tax=Chlorobium ferrooxidans DSM 13031 TaxID=377431 RepID=Q0YUS6_9CHLB|nr:phosphatidylserine decarboxylase [Chlorobium ferrooxidans]EAT59957.1 Phosphatidylserine decarboxylase-related [Chlorobium ferrooxidans DSM 13031]